MEHDDSPRKRARPAELPSGVARALSMSRAEQVELRAQRHAQRAATPTPLADSIVLVVPCASDPPTCALVSMAAAIVEKGAADEVWLLPFSKDYESVFASTPTARAVLMHVAVEFELSASMHAVKVAPPNMCAQATSGASLELLWEHIGKPPKCMVLRLPDHVPAASSPAHASVAAAARDLALEVCTACDLESVHIKYCDMLDEVQRRLRTRGPTSVIGLLPLAVGRVCTRYGVFGHGRAGHHRAVGFIDMVPDSTAAVPNGSHATQETGTGAGAGAGAGAGGGRGASPVQATRPRATALGSAVGTRETKRRVAILGGSFNPITDAHLHVASEVLASQMADEVWVVPCGARPDKPSVRTSSMQRFMMAVLSLEARLPAAVPVFVSAIEVFKPVAIASYVLLTELAAAHPQCTFALVIGTDLVESLPKWKHAKQLWSDVSFLVYERPGYPMPATLPPKAAVVSHPDGEPTVGIKMSSTRVRRLLVEGRSIDGLVPAPLANYIARYRMSSL